MEQQISPDEMMFFDKKPQVLPLYEALRGMLYDRHPDITIKVDKTQISFKNRYTFACASLQRVTGAPKDYQLVTFGLDHAQYSPRIAVTVEAAPNRWTHHVVVTEREELDEELLGWLEEAWLFCQRRGRRTKG